MTLTITGINTGSGAVRYLTESEGCARHAHDREADPLAYWRDGVGEERPLGHWHGKGLEALGLTAAEVTKSDVEAVFALMHPRRLEEAERDALEEAEARIASEGLTGREADQLRRAAQESARDAARLGRRPYQFKGLEERLGERLEAEGIDAADPVNAERIAALRVELAGEGRQARAFFDLTFSPSKSTSMYYAGLIARGDAVEAAKVRELHREAVEEALDFLEREAGLTRAGHHGAAAGDRASVGRWEESDGFTVAMFDHETNREGEPQLHTHAALLNRVRCVDQDGRERWRTVDSRGLHKARRGAAAIYERGLEQRIEAEFGVAYAVREDGKARELLGISAEERAAMSSRRAQVVAQVEEWAAQYEATHGYAPSRYARTVMAQAATLQTRKGKEETLSADELVTSWERMAGQRLKTTFGEIAERAEEAGIEARAAGDVTDWSRDVVIARALEKVQTEYSTWTRADLMFAIAQELPDRWGSGENVSAVLEGLADQALDGTRGTVLVQGMEVIDAPPELRREVDGRSVYRPARDERYASMRALEAEERVLARSRATGGLALNPETVADVLAQADERGRPLDGDQAAVVQGVLGGGRHIDVVVGPAGTGKSVAQGEIARAWTATGRRVIGLGPSSTAAHVLQEEGIALSMNTEKWLFRQQGMGPAAEVEAYALRPGDLVIMDEAGMASRDQIVQVARFAEAAGAKLVLCGDDAQLTAPEAGGLFEMLADEPHALELGTVRRFREADGTVRTWEAEASLGVREGRIEALTAYAEHGRIRSGTLEEMREAIRRAYVADRLNGVDSAVMTSTTEEAAELSALIREDLVRLGLVEAGGVALADGTTAGVGDLIQARQNLNSLTDSSGLPVYNRFVYRVIDREQDGSLRVQRVTGRDESGAEILGGTVALPADYVQEKVELRYAGTMHSVQGATVERGYQLVTPETGREAAYVGMTRGRADNRAYVVAEDGADSLEVLAGTLANSGAEKAAAQTLREELDWVDSLPAHGPVWDDLVTRHALSRHEEILRGLVDEGTYERLQQDDPSSLHRLLRAAAADGHDVEAVLTAAVGKRGMDDADNLAALLHWRVQRELNGREPEHEPAGPSWVERTPADMPEHVREYALAHAEAMDARREALGVQAVEAPQEWAERHLGPVPADPVERADWQTRAAAVAAYRERYQVDAPGTILGPVPAAGMVEQRQAWEDAHRALGRSEEDRRLAELSEAELAERVAAWEREQTWAPRPVAEELAAEEMARQDWEQRATYARVAAERESDPERRAVLLTEAADAADIARQLAEELRPEYETMHAARQAWHKVTAAVREAAAAAQAELERRAQDRAAEAEVLETDPWEAERTREVSEVEGIDPWTQEALWEVEEPEQVQEQAPEVEEPEQVQEQAPEVEQDGLWTQEALWEVEEPEQVQEQAPEVEAPEVDAPDVEQRPTPRSGMTQADRERIERAEMRHQVLRELEEREQARRSPAHEALAEVEAASADLTRAQAALGQAAAREAERASAAHAAEQEAEVMREAARIQVEQTLQIEAAQEIEADSPGFER